MSGDISKKTVAAFLVVAIAFSVMGTWVVMSKSPTVVDVSQTGLKGSPTAASQVKLTIGEPAPVSGQGQVSLIILPNDN